MKESVKGTFRCSVSKDGIVDPSETRLFNSQEELNFYYADRLKRYQAVETPNSLTSSHSFFKMAQWGVDKLGRTVSIEYIAYVPPQPL